VGYAGPVRRALVLLVAVSLPLIAGGCGSSSSSTGPSPLATELSYFPPGSPLMATIATDPQGSAVQNAEGLLGAFPLAKLGITGLESELESAGVDYQSEIEPLFGNPIAVGALALPTSAQLSGSSFLAVWITKSAAKLHTLIKGLNGFTARGTVDGATLYGSGAATLALDGATVIVGASRAEVSAALGRHAHGGGMSAADYAKAMGSLPQHSLVQAFGSLSSVLSAPSAAAARRIPWVAAIRGYAASVSVTSAGLSVQFRLDTSGASLSGSELPISSGTAAAQLSGTLPTAVGVRDGAQTLSFAESVERSVDPASYARFMGRENAAKRKTGYDLNTFAALLTGNLIVESDTRTTMGRAEVSDPASAARQLAKLPEVVREVFHTASGISRLPGGFYAVKEGRGKTFNLGLVGNEFVAGLATAAQLEAFAAAPAAPAPNVQGSVAFRISLLELLKLALRHTPNSLITSVLSTLGDVTGSASATPGALTGRLGLAVK